VGRLRVAVGLLAMFVGGGGVVLGLVMFAGGMVVGRLVVMMSCGMVMRGRIMMVLSRRMLALFGHVCSPGWHFGGDIHHVGRQHTPSPSFLRSQDSCRYHGLLVSAEKQDSGDGIDRDHSGGTAISCYPTA
jgi:hypothetical protein